MVTDRDKHKRKAIPIDNNESEILPNEYPFNDMDDFSEDADNFLNEITNENDSSDEELVDSEFEESDIVIDSDQESDIDIDSEEDISEEDEDCENLTAEDDDDDEDDSDDDDNTDTEGNSASNTNYSLSDEESTGSEDEFFSSDSDSGEDCNTSDPSDSEKREESIDKIDQNKVKNTEDGEHLNHTKPNSKKTKNNKSSSLKEKKNRLKTNKSKSGLLVKENDSNGKNLGYPTKDEYAEGDTSDEEDIRNTIGNVPVNWYDEYKHLGYDWEGKQILKPDHGDQLDYFLRRMEDPNFWRTVRDPQTGQDVVLSDGDVSLIQRIESQKIPDEAYDEYAPWIEWFSSEVMKMPLRKFPEHKRSFLPSLNEKRKVAKLVHALKMGWIKPSKKLKKERIRKLKSGPQFYMLWESDDVSEEMRRLHKHIPAPKRQLPGHAESYNPPAEYLFSEKEMEKFDESKRSIGNKKLHFVPKKYSSLRQVPAYDRFIKERFTRCLDLYLCPRAVKMKLMIEPEDLLPKLPSPKDLQPFPTVESLIFKGHTDMVRTISMDPLGQYIVSGSDDQTVKFWEVSTARCLNTVKLDGIIRCVRWCPSTSLSLVAVACDNKCYIINPGLGDSLVTSKTNTVLEEPPLLEGLVPERVSTAVQWNWRKDNEDFPDGVLVMIKHFKEIKQIAWHGRGDYFATVMPEGANRSVIIHQLSKGRSQIPFSKSKGLIQCVIFHPVRPFFFVASQKNVRIYDLVKQEMIKKLYSNCKWISNIAIHPGGDNLLLSSYDSKVVWFDLDLSTKPYKVLRLHNCAVRSVAYHKRYPLFASVSDDCSLIISHGMVYNDLMQNALIVPLKRLSYHKNENDYGIFEVMFHHFQPWVLTCGADSTIRLYS